MSARIKRARGWCRRTKPKVTESSGCVFCDLDLAAVTDPTDKDATLFIHKVTSNANDGLRHTVFIPCPVKNK